MDFNTILLITIGVPVFLFALFKYLQGPDCPDQTTKLDGKVALVTGANTGIGYETALEFAARGARVLLACRDVQRGEIAAARIREATGNQDVAVRQLNLSSFSSVRACAKQILQEERRLDILVNNAGCMMYHFQKTEDGLETQLQANHLSHHLLTALLMPLLKSTNNGNTRVVVLTSLMHSKAKSIPFEDVNHEKNPSSYSCMTVYSMTKLMNVLFTKELARRLKDTKVTVNCVHPGLVTTDIPRNFPWPINVLYPFACGLFQKTPRKGAQTSIWAAIDPSLDGNSGNYMTDCAITPASREANDVGLAKRVWEMSDKLSGAHW